MRYSTQRWEMPSRGAKSGEYLDLCLHVTPEHSLSGGTRSISCLYPKSCILLEANPHGDSCLPPLIVNALLVN